jgi:cytochrome c|tara:strand:+ start:123 stop:692 length:570 start_codon:yes stop_codon:yes gene_type:complete
MLYVQNNNFKMDSFELNKIIAAILMVALLVIGLGKLADGVFYTKIPEKPGYKVEVENQVTSSVSQVSEIVEKIDIAAVMAQGDIVSGEKIFKKCAACHSINKGGANKIGPALYNVVGRKVGSVSDYKYSKTLASYEKEWTFEELNGFLQKPSSYLKGTKMSYAGLRKEKDRASIIKYLNQSGDSPKPLP